MPAVKTIRKYSRRLHRDIGYLLVGLSILYAISGIILIFKKQGQDPAYKEMVFEKHIPAQLSGTELKANWSLFLPNAPKLAKLIEKGRFYNLVVEGGYGEYAVEEGKVTYHIYKERSIIKFMNDIHVNTGKHFNWLGTFFAAALSFLALTGLILIKGKNGFKTRGVYFMLAGIVLPVLWYLFI